jgi:hypothetical protein
LIFLPAPRCAVPIPCRRHPSHKPACGPILSLLLANATTTWRSVRHANQRQSRPKARLPPGRLLSPPTTPSSFTEPFRSLWAWLPRTIASHHRPWIVLLSPSRPGLADAGWKESGGQRRGNVPHSVTLLLAVLTFRVKHIRAARQVTWQYEAADWQLGPSIPYPPPTPGAVTPSQPVFDPGCAWSSLVLSFSATNPRGKWSTLLRHYYDRPGWSEVGSWAATLAGPGLLAVASDPSWAREGIP